MGGGGSKSKKASCCAYHSCSPLHFLSRLPFSTLFIFCNHCAGMIHICAVVAWCREGTVDSCHKQPRRESRLQAQIALFSFIPSKRQKKNFVQCLEIERMNHSAIKLYADVTQSIVSQRARRTIIVKFYERNNIVIEIIGEEFSTQLLKAKVSFAVKMNSICVVFLRQSSMMTDEVSS